MERPTLGGNLAEESTIAISSRIRPKDSGLPEPACMKESEFSGNSNKIRTKRKHLWGGTLNINSLLQIGKN